MTTLTPEIIAAAPEGATHYYDEVFYKIENGVIRAARDSGPWGYSIYSNLYHATPLPAPNAAQPDGWTLMPELQPSAEAPAQKEQAAPESTSAGIGERTATGRRLLEEMTAGTLGLVRASDSAGIASFEPPPEVVAEPKPAQVSTHGRRWAWLLGVR